MREQREREAKPELRLGGQSAAKQRGSAELSDEHVLILHCPPLKDQPVKILTRSRMLVSLTLNEPSLAAMAPGQMDEELCSSVTDVLQASLAPQQHQLPQAQVTSISHTTVPPAASPEPVPARQRRRKPRATQLGRPASASRKTTSAGFPLKRRRQPRNLGPVANGT